jgi:dihydroorotate dehydrogenase electron transfer subunit
MALVPLPGSVPAASQQLARVALHERMARDTFRMRLHCPKIAGRITPGQFFMLRPPDGSDPLLGRPFALYDTYLEDGKPAGVDFGYLVVGKMTALLSRLKPGDSVTIWGPLGNGFPAPPSGHLMCVAGGIGQTPFLAVAREALGLRTYGDPPRGEAMNRRPENDSSLRTGKERRVTMLYGVRSADYLAGLDDFSQLDGLEMRLATDDGSRGHHGFVTELLRESLTGGDRPDEVYCCGPEPMMHAAARICAEHGVPCRLSLETPMACGFGACFSCVARVRQPNGSWDYRRTCVEGPVFDAGEIVF